MPDPWLQAGATGNETAAADCMAQWHSRIPAMQAELEKVRQKLWKALPNLDADGHPLSGSFWAETDCTTGSPCPARLSQTSKPPMQPFQLHPNRLLYTSSHAH